MLSSFDNITFYCHEIASVVSNMNVICLHYELENPLCTKTQVVVNFC